MKRTVRCLAIVIALLIVSAAAFAQVSIGIRVSFGPPALPVYEQPMCPQPGFIWVPGYWAWDNDYGYYWVPGTWVMAPEVGYLWTPGWWGWDDGFYVFHRGYWAREVGFYGGINYGYGYNGEGYYGGRWQGDRFYYNRSVTNINVTNIKNVYNTTVTNVSNSHVSYNGGQGGVMARPTAAQQAVELQRHLEPVAAQTQHVQAARVNPQLRASVNQGRPPIAATVRPAAFNGPVVAARAAGAPYHPPAKMADTLRGPTPGHASEVAPHAAPAPAQPMAAEQQQQQRQREELSQRQNQEHADLQQRQQQEHERAQQQSYNAEQQRRMERAHAQQTREMEQRHAMQTQHMEQQRQAPPPRPMGPPRPEPHR